MQKRIVHQAMVNGLLNPRRVLCAQFRWDLDANPEILHPRRVLHFLRRSSDASAFRTKLVLPHILRRIVPGAGTQRRKQQLWRRHSFVVAAVFHGLVARDYVTSSPNFELDRADMFHCDFHGYLL